MYVQTASLVPYPTLATVSDPPDLAMRALLGSLTEPLRQPTKHQRCLIYRSSTARADIPVPFKKRLSHSLNDCQSSEQRTMESA
jgi:hypothetical protein